MINFMDDITLRGLLFTRSMSEKRLRQNAPPRPAQRQTARLDAGAKEDWLA
jgi:hypothetical protein